MSTRMRGSSATSHARNSSEWGGISINGILVFVFLIAIIWGAVTLLPAFQIPYEMEGELESAAKTFIGLPPGPDKKKAERQLQKELTAIIERRLENHIWDEEELEISVANKLVTVELPYTIIVRPYGIEMVFEKELDLRVRGTNF